MQFAWLNSYLQPSIGHAHFLDGFLYFNVYTQGIYTGNGIRLIVSTI